MLRIHGTMRSRGSGCLVDGLDESANVAVAEGEGLERVGIGVVGGEGDVIGHEHVGIADLFVDVDGFDEIDVALVGEDFDEVVAMAADVAEVYVEDLLAGAEVADDVVRSRWRDSRGFRRWCPGRS